MIIVANQPVELNRAEWSDFEWYWLQQLQNRPTRYVYQSMDHLRFEWDLRGSLVDAAEGLDRSGVSFASFEKSRCNPAYWNRNAEGGFELKSNVTPLRASGISGGMDTYTPLNVQQPPSLCCMVACWEAFAKMPLIRCFEICYYLTGIMTVTCD